MIQIAAKEDMLLRLASRFVGYHEVGGNNRGPLLDLWEKRQVGATGWPWCLIFIQELADTVDDLYDAAHLMSSNFRHGLPDTAHVMTLWRALEAYQLVSPRPGCLVIWNKEGTDSGHVGLVTGYQGGGSIETIEGNTGSDMRDGDVVASKTRSIIRSGDLTVMGFLPVWR